MLWLCLALGAALPATYGIMAVKRDMAATAAYKSGRDDAAKIIAAEVTSKSLETVERAEAGRTEAEPAPEDDVGLVALCRSSASCRERGAR